MTDYINTRKCLLHTTTASEVITFLLLHSSFGKWFVIQLHGSSVIVFVTLTPLVCRKQADIITVLTLSGRDETSRYDTIR